MSKPMPRKISFSSPSTCSNGWRLPRAGCLPGSVTSMRSASSRAASVAASNSAVRRTISSVMASRTSFANAPITGRSSAVSLPICLRMAVSSPFLPRKRTRSSSTAAAFCAAAISASAFLRMPSNACLMLLLLPFVFLPKSVGFLPKAPRMPTGRLCVCAAFRQPVLRAAAARLIPPVPGRDGRLPRENRRKKGPVPAHLSGTKPAHRKLRGTTHVFAVQTYKSKHSFLL